ncbi:hypothetical protein [Meridianimarinicoccus aquatilis]|uniref:Uncharacterized protein n=1 Tax=Meridianimarinicoccus aquatilis TaxID=2552766 RepID=A0A4R6B5Q5_9RHOB|nr:hypothetical protein [Fluviibacterium aquatile]QIE42304.1 hypothetical protein G5B39_10365 [Rhodobacteraceae bacterium SC52]TDL91293.1 hypothetical protein E2L05_01570 [Fluviibacterium aquatile]
MRKPFDPIDPKGMIAESYVIDGIDAGQCRSIFLDWALSTEIGPNGTAPLITELLTRHGQANPSHPMTEVLREGLACPARTGRRGGRASRVG